MRKRLNVKLISESANAKVSEFTNAHTSKCANTHESEHANAHTSKHANACTNEPVNARMRITALLNLITALIYPYNCPCPPAILPMHICKWSLFGPVSLLVFSRVLATFLSSFRLHVSVMIKLKIVKTRNNYGYVRVWKGGMAQG